MDSESWGDNRGDQENRETDPNFVDMFVDMFETLKLGHSDWNGLVRDSNLWKKPSKTLSFKAQRIDFIRQMDKNIYIQS